MGEHTKDMHASIQPCQGRRHSFEFRSGNKSVIAKGWGLAVVIVSILTLAGLRIGGYL